MSITSLGAMAGKYQWEVCYFLKINGRKNGDRTSRWIRKRRNKGLLNIEINTVLKEKNFNAGKIMIIICIATGRE
ncbi:hypothetical protein [Salmonella sp. S094_02810]|uniref:hypothetical protein n=1 Tax=Salmonella sp. S094_02810 TaxID=2665587 RepID=UPI00165991CC|nr:hypothetical protein [Salmonella sp. S094_02810]